MSRFFSKMGKSPKSASRNGESMADKKEDAKTRVQRLDSTSSLPGDGKGFFDMSSYNTDVQKSDLDNALIQHNAEAEALAEKIRKRAHRSDGEHHPTAELEKMALQTYKLEGCYFIGHTNTDMDSVASAIGGAELFGGTATRAEREVNGEIVFACEYAKVDLPPFFDDVKDAASPKNPRGIVLVDHNEPGQMIESLGKTAFPDKGASKEALEASALQVARIKGVIDHHALSDKFATGHPLFIDIKPWGSACSIIAHQFVRVGKPIPKHVCIVLLCGILSDTINLTSPTTTQADRVMATLLGLLGEEKHPNRLAKEMFKAKTAHLCNLPAYSIVRADQKNFQMGNYLVGWATIEVNEPEKILAKSRKLLLELRVLKEEKKLDFVFLSVVDLQKMETKLLLCGAGEVQLATEVFKGKLSNALDHCPTEEECEGVACKHKGHNHGPISNATKELDTIAHVIHLNPTNSLMDIGKLVSRKLEFIPPVKKALTGGWKPSRQSMRLAQDEKAPNVHTQHVHMDGAGCTIARTFSIDENQQAGDK